jgi:hypothetical protein
LPIGKAFIPDAGDNGGRHSGTNAAAIPQRCDPRHDHWTLAAEKDRAHRFRQCLHVVLLGDVNTSAQ